MAKSALSCLESRDRRDVWNAGLLHGCRFDGEYDIPTLQACNCVPTRLIAFTDASIKKADDAYVHFYEDDYKFERIWRNPKRYLPLIQAYGGAIAPDFSVYREMPLLLQMYNIFRSRSIGYWWARNGINVIPNVRWGNERTYSLCFDGLPKNSIVAIGTHGCVRRIDDRRYFNNSFMEMLDRINPKTVIVYGSASEKLFPPLFVCNIEIICFESEFSRSRKRKAV